MSEEKISVSEWHKKQAVDNFNGTWDLIDKGNDRTEDDNVEMIHKAHASRFHWGQIGTPTHFLRGEWQISRVYSLVGLAESALYHARLSLNLCLENNIGDFDLAFAYEALARAYSISKDKEKMDENISLAKKVAENIEKEDDRDYFLSELETVKM